MSKRTLIAIYDTKALDVVGPISLMRHDAAAVRMFTDVMQYEQYKPHMADFNVVALGIFDDDTMQVEAHKPRIILKGETLVATQTKENEL